ncbi:MAG: NlpC/P60 family protein [Micrococcaceae bacterium]
MSSENKGFSRRTFLSAMGIGAASAVGFGTLPAYAADGTWDTDTSTDSVTNDSNLTLYAFGANTKSQIPADAGNDSVWKPNKITFDTEAKPLKTAATNGTQVIGINTDGKLIQWGYSEYAKKEYKAPVEITGGDAQDVKFSSVAVSALAAVALDTDGNLYGWGDAKTNGTGSKQDNPTKITVVGAEDAKFKTIALGSGVAFAIDEAGNLYGWGDAKTNGTGKAQTTPTKIDSSAKFTAIAAGLTHTLAADADGKLYGWGAGAYNGISKDSATPVAVTTGIDGVKITQVAAGSTHSVILADDNSLYAWGAANTNGTGTEQKQPSPIVSTTKFKAITAGNAHTLAIAESDDLYVWGLNGRGQLGMGDDKQDDVKEPTLNPVLSGTTNITTLMPNTPTTNVSFVIEGADTQITDSNLVSSDTSSDSTDASSDTTSDTSDTTSDSTDASSDTTSDSSDDTEASASGDSVVDIAKSYVGLKNYGWGDTPTLWNCTGFTHYVYTKAGIALPWGWPADQAEWALANGAEKVSTPAAGDLVVQQNGGSGQAHVGIYAEDGNMYAAINTELGTGIQPVSWGSGTVYYRFK